MTEKLSVSMDNILIRAEKQTINIFMVCSFQKTRYLRLKELLYQWLLISVQVIRAILLVKRLLEILLMITTVHLKLDSKEFHRACFKIHQLMVVFANDVGRWQLR
jgi:hypothetical protein